MNRDFKPTNYHLQSFSTKRIFEDSGWLLSDPQLCSPSLIRAVYDKKQIDFKDNSWGLYRFSDWLPINRVLKGSSAPITYKSRALAEHLGLSNLYITFSGYFPQIGATMKSCSFKETEAYSVCGRLKGDEKGVLVVASAGNTARAFANVCSQNKIPIVICVPQGNIEALWFDQPLNPCVKLVTTADGSDYFDAIRLGNEIVNNDGFFAEGGATNVARRDGMGTTMLSAVDVIGRCPDYYFQAIGSGTGAIAAWEANLRLLEDGRFGKTKTKLITSQNAPFLLMERSWKEDSRELIEYDATDSRVYAHEIDAKVLSNRKPPYSVPGGLYDALKDSQGDILAVSNERARVAADLFEELEGIDIHPAAAVAVESLVEYVSQDNFDKEAVIMLNITGGGEKRFLSQNKAFYLKPSHIFPIHFTSEQVTQALTTLF